ncbi:hypothetical protein [Pseudonocardia sp. GCM10023141]|uniref:hypothetical protein n=1 Tax=Pseudonocardia sp. GCM10023141 TaxID=3252653 RepID=UPI00361FA9CC
MTIPCPGCAQAVPVTEFLAECTTYAYGPGSVCWTCPACADLNQFRIVDGSVEIGYVYLAGAAHFATMDEVAVPGLTVVPSPEQLLVHLGERTWTIAAGRYG